MRWLATLVLIVLLAAGAAYLIAGRGEPPRLTIDKPAKANSLHSARNNVAARGHRSIVYLLCS